MKEITFGLSFLFVLILAGFPEYGKAQEPTTEKLKPLYFGVSYSPDYSFRFIRRNDFNLSNSNWNQIKDAKNDFESSIYGYHVGINGGIRVHRRWELEAGLQFSRRGYQIESIIITDASGVGELSQVIQQFEFLSIPLRIQMMVYEGDLEVRLGGGASIDFLRDYTQRIIPLSNPSQEEESGSNASVADMNATQLLYADVRYAFSDAAYIRAAPTLRFSYVNVFPVNIAAEHLWSLGCDFGVGIRF